MGHLEGENVRLIQRVRRLRGQLEAVERMLVEGEDCYAILQTVAACRGGLNGLTRELILEHIEHHVGRGEGASEAIRQASEELKLIIGSYLK